MRNKLAIYLVLGAFVSLAAWAYVVSAPQIEDKVTRTALQDVPNGIHGVNIAVDGRDIHLSGLTQDAQEREVILAAAQNLYGRRVVTEDLQVLDIASPYLFEARATSDGYTVSGNVPSEALRKEVAALFDTDAAALTLSAGAPDGDWMAALAISEAALRQIEGGQLNLTDATLTLSGKLSDPYVLEDVAAVLASLPPEFTARIDVETPETSPYIFEAFKTDDAKTFRLFSPSRDVEASLLENLPAQWTGTTIPAFGAPNSNWPNAAAALVRAAELADIATVLLQDTEVFFEANAPTLEVEDMIIEILSGLPDAYTLERVLISVPPAVPYLFTGIKTSDGLQFEGYIPSAILRAEFATFIGAEAAGGLERRAGMPDGFWPEFVKNGVAALGALEAGTLRIKGRAIHLTGVAANPVMAAAIESALSDLPAGYGAQFNLELEDDGQPTFLALAYEEGQPVSLTGKAPAGLTVEKAETALEISEIIATLRDSVLSGEDFYIEKLSALSSHLVNFKLLNLTFSETDAKISGVARPGRNIDALTEIMTTIFGDNTEVSIQATPTDVEDGTVRTNDLTGLVEVFRNQQWQPFATEGELLESCETRVEALLANTTIQFQSGSSVIDPASDPIIDDLAAILAPCLSNSSAIVELGGHTDNEGDPAANLALSETRAAAVRDALLSRGIPATRISSQGFGDTSPIASNDTAEGRAANRRTSFKWITE